MSVKYEVQAEEADSSGGKKGIVRFNGALDMAGWEELRQDVLRRLGSGCLTWEFDLTGLEHCLSVDLGMWITMNVTIKNHEGRLSFLVARDSGIDRIISVTRLARVLDIHLL